MGFRDGGNLEYFSMMMPEGLECDVYFRIFLGCASGTGFYKSSYIDIDIDIDIHIYISLSLSLSICLHI